MVHKKTCNSSSIAGIFYHSRSRCTFREAGVGDCFSVAGVVKQGKIYLSCKCFHQEIMFMLSYDTDRKKRMKANNTQNIDYIFNFSWW